MQMIHGKSFIDNYSSTYYIIESKTVSLYVLVDSYLKLCTLSGKMAIDVEIIRINWFTVKSLLFLFYTIDTRNTVKFSMYSDWNTTVPSLVISTIAIIIGRLWSSLNYIILYYVPIELQVTTNRNTMLR